MQNGLVKHSNTHVPFLDQPSEGNRVKEKKEKVVEEKVVLKGR